MQGKLKVVTDNLLVGNKEGQNRWRAYGDRTRSKREEAPPYVYKTQLRIKTTYLRERLKGGTLLPAHSENIGSELGKRSRP
jgi:hypothetical protein